MKKLSRSSKSQYGFADLGVIIAVIAMLAVGGLIAWRLMGPKQAHDSSTQSNAIAKKIAEAHCDYDDKDLCKFFVSWKEHSSYRMISTGTSDGQTASSTYEVEGKDKYHMISSGVFNAETIGIGNVLYTKDPADGKWWKQTMTEDKARESKLASGSVELDEPSKQSDQSADKTSYKKLSKEACGKLTCFKYQAIDPSAQNQTQYLWFDDKDYQLRRMRTESADPNQTYDMNFSYDNVKISAPSPTKDLAPNQVIIPGQSQPMTLPE